MIEVLEPTKLMCQCVSVLIQIPSPINAQNIRFRTPTRTAHPSITHGSASESRGARTDFNPGTLPQKQTHVASSDHATRSTPFSPRTTAPNPRPSLPSHTTLLCESSLVRVTTSALSCAIDVANPNTGQTSPFRCYAPTD